MFGKTSIRSCPCTWLDRVLWTRSFACVGCELCFHASKMRFRLCKSPSKVLRPETAWTSTIDSPDETRGGLIILLTLRICVQKSPETLSTSFVPTSLLEVCEILEILLRAMRDGSLLLGHKEGARYQASAQESRILRFFYYEMMNCWPSTALWWRWSTKNWTKFTVSYFWNF